MNAFDGKREFNQYVGSNEKRKTKIDQQAYWAAQSLLIPRPSPHSPLLPYVQFT